MSKDKLKSNEIESNQLGHYPTHGVGINLKLAKENRNSPRGIVETVRKRIKKIRWPRGQQQFYVGPGVDWD